MPLMTWNPELELKVDEMNRQHQQLLSYMNKLFDLNENKAHKVDILNALEILGKYTVQHFEEEEQYMESIQYPKIEVHKVIHKDLLSKFAQHKDDFVNASEELLSPEFFEFLKLWLRAHIMGIDKQYSEHSTSNQAA